MRIIRSRSFPKLCREVATIELRPGDRLCCCGVKRAGEVVVVDQDLAGLHVYARRKTCREIPSGPWNFPVDGLRWNLLE